MKQIFLKTTPILLLLALLASCKKEATTPPPGPVPAEAVTSSTAGTVANLSVAKQLTKITNGGSPHFNFQYDAATARLTKVYNNAQAYYYTYGTGVLVLTKFVPGKADAQISFAGKTDAAGRLTSTVGYVIDASMKIPTKQWFKYDTLGRISLIKSEMTRADGVHKGIQRFHWSNGNIIKETFTYDDVLRNTITYEYSGALTDKRGVWQKPFSFYADKFLGKRNKNLITKITEKSTAPGAVPLVTTNTWKLDAGGYPLSCVEDAPSSMWGPVSYQYFFQ